MLFLNSKKKINHILKINYNLIRLIKVIFSRLYIRFIASGLDVPKWHLNATFHTREYKSKVVKIYKTFNNKIDHVIEVGCGSGELISRLKNCKKLGIDVDNNVLNLCKRLHPDLKTNCLDVIKEYSKFEKYINEIDKDSKLLIIMVNWLHMYKSDQANLLIKKILSLKKNTIVILDIYSRPELSKISENKIRHNFCGINEIKWSFYIRLIDEVRDINLLANYVPKVDMEIQNI